MPDMNQKLARFTAAILAEATAESQRTMESVRQRTVEAYSQAEDKVLQEAYQYIHQEVGLIKTEAGRRVSRHMLESKRQLFLRREEMARETFALVREKITAFTASPAYSARLKELLNEALEALAGAEDVQVYLRQADMPLSQELAQTVPGRQLAFVEGDFQLGGLMAESQALGLRVDSSFDSTAAELSGHFAELCGISLSEELENDTQEVDAQ